MMEMSFRTLFLTLLLLFSLLYVAHCRTERYGQPSSPSTYRVAVYEHATIPGRKDLDTREEAIAVMKRNIAVYNESMNLAKRQGAKLIVFPEYGIFDTFMTRERLSLFAEPIPDPKISHRNLCRERGFKDSPILRILSCMARYNHMFLVVNVAGRETCNDEADCPPDGQYLYNTNVVFSPVGELVARYYKTNLFEEDYFDSAKSIEMAIFDTPFGKFGTFICFDILFKSPARDLIEKHNVRNLVYPTAWVEVAPFFRSLSVHSGFARGARVNLLSANIYWPETKSYGSGIYTPNGPAIYYHSSNRHRGKLLVSDIHRIDDVRPDVVETHFDNSQETGGEDVLNLFAPNELPPIKFKLLQGQSGSISVCHNSFCCQLIYSLSGQFQEVYGLGAYQGYMLASNNSIYAEMCTLVACPDSRCGSPISDASTEFSHISLRRTGNSSNYVFPSVVAMNRGQHELVPDAWTYSETRGIETRPGETITLHSANIIGRVFSRDILLRDAHKENSGNFHLITSTISYILYCITGFLMAAL